jgi:hypothetical protein
MQTHGSPTQSARSPGTEPWCGRVWVHEPSDKTVPSVVVGLGGGDAAARAGGEAGRAGATGEGTPRAAEDQGRCGEAGRQALARDKGTFAEGAAWDWTDLVPCVWKTSGGPV